MQLKAILLTLGLAMAAGAFTTGCGASCEGICDDAQKCEGAQKEDCAKECDKAETLNDKASCGDQYDEVLSCYDDQDDICKVGDKCDSQVKAYGECLSKYCADHASDCT